MPAIEFTIDPTVRCSPDEVRAYAARVQTKLGLQYLRAVTTASRDRGVGVGRIICLLDEADSHRLPEVCGAMEARFTP